MRFSKIKFRKTFAVIFACALMLSLAACGKNNAKDEKGNTETEESTAEEMIFGNYEESLAVSENSEKGSPYYGVMYVTVLDVNGNVGDSSAVYSFKDKSDPDNAWSVSGIEIGDIEAEVYTGAEVAILFHGDVIRDGENIEFIAILPDGKYQLKKAEGITTSNTMSSFKLNTYNGEISFNKDNCRVEDGAMNSDSGDSIVVYYADGGELGNFPLGVYKRG